LSSEQEFSGEQSRQIAVLTREEIARRRMSRQQLADKAKLSLSTLEKVLGGRRPLTLATAVRVEEALGVSLRAKRARCRCAVEGRCRTRRAWRLFAPRRDLT
jgi:transcriptional regulator with XRE-family HTH domain